MPDASGNETRRTARSAARTPLVAGFAVLAVAIAGFFAVRGFRDETPSVASSPPVAEDAAAAPVVADAEPATNTGPSVDPVSPFPAADTVATAETGACTADSPPSTADAAAPVPTAQAEEVPPRVAITDPDAPRMAVLGNGQNIARNDFTPAGGDHTDFGWVFQGQEARVHTLRIANMGGVPLPLGTVELPRGFRLLTPPPEAVAPGETVALRIALDSAEPGSKTGPVFIHSSAVPHPFVFWIRGTVASRAAIGVSGNGNRIPVDGAQPRVGDHTDFGTAYASGDSIVRTFTLHNDSAVELAVGEIRLPDCFVLVRAPAPTIPAGARSTFEVRLATPSPGEKSGVLRIFRGDLDQELASFAIRGVVGEPRAILEVLAGDPSAGGNLRIVNGDATPGFGDGTNFGNAIPYGATLVRTFTLRNAGGLPLTLGAVEVPAGFVLTDPPTGSLQPGESRDFAVRIDTTIAGAPRGEIRIHSSDSPQSPYTFVLAGTVAQPLPPIAVRGNEANIPPDQTQPQTQNLTDFGELMRLSSPRVHTFTIHNTGESPLALGAVRVPAGFQLVSAPAAMLEAGQSTVLGIALEAALVTSREGTVEIPYGVGDVFRFAVRGQVTVAAPVMTVLGEGAPVDINAVFGGVSIPPSDGIFVIPSSPNSSAGAAYFGLAAAGGLPVVRTFTIRNDGTVPLQVAITSVPSGFSVVSHPARDVLPGESTSFQVQMNPGNTAPISSTNRQGVITIQNNASNTAFSLRLIGVIVQPSEARVAVSEGDVRIEHRGGGDTEKAIDFGTIVQAGGAPLRTFTIRNDGVEPLSIYGVSAPSGFRVVDRPSIAAILPGATTTFTVQLDSNVAGIRSGDILINSNARNPEFAGLVAFAFRVQGTVEPVPIMAVYGNTVPISRGKEAIGTVDNTDFGSTSHQGAFITRAFAIRNTGGAPLILAAIELPDGFILALPPATTVQANSSTTFQVQMASAVVGVHAGTIAIHSNDETQPPYTFAVRGQVAPPAAGLTMSGNGNPIAAGSFSSNVANHTDFGRVLQGSVAVRTFVIRNSGGAILQVNEVRVPEGFVLVTPPAGEVGPGQTTSFDIALDTTAPVIRTGAIAVVSNDPARSLYLFGIRGVVEEPAPPRIALSGNNVAIAAGSAEPRLEDHTDFGSIAVNGTVIRTFRIVNASDAVLTLGAVTVPPGFVLLSPPQVTVLPPGAPTTFRVQLDSATSGTHAGQIRIDDGGDQAFAFAIRGVVAAPAPGIP